MEERQRLNKTAAYLCLKAWISMSILLITGSPIVLGIWAGLTGGGILLDLGINKGKSLKLFGKQVKEIVKDIWFHAKEDFARLKKPMRWCGKVTGITKLSRFIKKTFGTKGKKTPATETQEVPLHDVESKTHMPANQNEFNQSAQPANEPANQNVPQQQPPSKGASPAV